MSDLKVDLNKKEKTKKLLSFSAIDPFKTDPIPSPKESENRGQNWVVYGEKNAYPNFLYSLYQDDATLQGIIDGMVDYCVGQEIRMNFDLGWGPGIVNRTGQGIEELARNCFSDLAIFGGYYIQVIRSNDRRVKELYWLDYRFVRTDKNNQTFWYSEDFADNKSYGRCKTILYPKFVQGFDDIETSVYFYKRSQSRGVYALPVYNGAIKSIVTDMKINNFSLNEVENNFTASALINFCNGIPDDETKEEMERDLEEKFSGSENAGRFIISYNVDQDHATKIERIQSDDFDKRYEALQKRVQSQIYVAMRANPQLFGMPVEGTGFAGQEYEAAFQLYLRSVINPCQLSFIGVLDRVMDMEGSVTITQFPPIRTQNN